MRLIVQRVRWAQVEVAGSVVGRIEQGLLVYVGIAAGDTRVDGARASVKVAHLRTFEDQAGKLNRSLQDVRGGVLAIPDRALMVDAAKDRDLAFAGAARGETARCIFAGFLSGLEAFGLNVLMGVFGAHMEVRSAADGPVNIVLNIPHSPDEEATGLASDPRTERTLSPGRKGADPR